MNATLVAMVGTAGILAVTTGVALAQGYVYPSRGQDAQQQQRDMGDCHVWATQQTGVNPAAMAPPSTAPQGQVVQGAARGAMVGVVGGAIAGDPGKGAAIGAASGALIGGFRRVDQQRAQQQAQAQSAAPTTEPTAHASRGVAIPSDEHQGER